MLRANYIFRVDRVVKERSKGARVSLDELRKTPGGPSCTCCAPNWTSHKPHCAGRKHVKFPTKVEPHPVQEFLPDSFYVWRGVDAPKSLWTTLGPALLVFIVLAVTLFPVAPYKVKLGVVYTAMGMLCLLFIVSVLRVILFALIWVGTGRYVWLLPNLYADDIPITRNLTPLIEETPRGPPASTAASSKKPDAASSSSDAAAAAGSQLVPTQEEAEGPSLASRLQVAFALVLACYAMYSALPEGTGVVSTAVGTSNSILEMLNLHEAGAKRLSEGGVGGGDGDANSSSLANLHPTLGLGPQAPPMTAAEAAAAAALKGGKVGPAGVKPVDAGLTAEQLSNLAPIPEEEDEDGATAGQPVADGVGAGQDSADLIRAEATAPDAEVHQPKEDL